jgi:hypothetical protein
VNSSKRCRTGGQGGAGLAAPPLPAKRACWGRPHRGGARHVRRWMSEEGGFRGWACLCYTGAPPWRSRRRESTGVRRHRRRARQGRRARPSPGPASAGCAASVDPAGVAPPRCPAGRGPSEREGARGGAIDDREESPEMRRRRRRCRRPKP